MSTMTRLAAFGCVWAFVSVAVAEPRFTINEGGTVTDNETGLTWLQDADCFDLRTYDAAEAEVSALADGPCSPANDDPGSWRLPTIEELTTLLAGVPPDHPYENPNVPDTEGTGQWSQGDPFIDLRSEAAPLDLYWSSSIVNCTEGYRRTMSFFQGFSLGCLGTGELARVLPVRDEVKEIEIVYKTFIPCEVIPAPGFTRRRYFGGDDRDFSYSSPDYRSMQSVTVTTSVQAEPIVSGPDDGSGVTKEYDRRQVTGRLPVRGNLCRLGLRIGAEPIQTGEEELAETPSQVNVVRDITDFERTNVEFVLSAANPLFFGSPPIDAVFTVSLFDTEPVEYSISGDHDGFPAHEIYINGVLVYGYDPRDSGKTPWALFGGLDQKILVPRQPVLP